LGLSQKQN
ncbi:putative virulence-mediating VirC domain protein, partial [Vibrio parahaemolyticus V-223/04]